MTAVNFRARQYDHNTARKTDVGTWNPAICLNHDLSVRTKISPS
ncbi:hypothetical protein B566_EDAN011501 [Ephemera danica]|nr:hypothetical protein B566_EDAN011501 [Ephemera danica]